MKRFLKLILPLFFLFVFAVPALAQFSQVASPSSTIIKVQEMSLEEVRERLMMRREEIRTEIETRKEERRVRLTERKKEQIRLLFSRMTKRFQAVIDRLERLVSRIESRLSKLETKDSQLDTSAIRQALDQIKDQLAEANAALSQAETSLEDILAADDAKEAFTDLRSLVKGIKQELIEVRRLLAQLIGDIRGLRLGQEEE